MLLGAGPCSRRAAAIHRHRHAGRGPEETGAPRWGTPRTSPTSSTRLRMADAFYRPNRPPNPARQPQSGELLFEFPRGHDRFLCELRDHGAYGIEAQFWKNEE